jgi:hypothetical protein
MSKVKERNHLFNSMISLLYPVPHIQMVMHCHCIKKKKNSEYDLTTVARFSSPFSAKEIRSSHSSCYQGKRHNYSTSFIQAKKSKY